MSRLVLFVVFVVVVCPTSLALWVLRRDPLRRRFRAPENSCWIRLPRHNFERARCHRMY